jgi:hypothetical protein
VSAEAHSARTRASALFATNLASMSFPFRHHPTPAGCRRPQLVNPSQE